MHSSIDIEGDGYEDEMTPGSRSMRRRVASGVVLPNLDTMARASFSKASKNTSPTGSSNTSRPDTSRETSADYDTAGTTPAGSVRGATSLTKRKRSSLAQVIQLEDSEGDEDYDDESFARYLQEEEYAKAGAEPVKKRTKLEIEDSEDRDGSFSDAETSDAIPLSKARGKRPMRKLPVKRAKSTRKVLDSEEDEDIPSEDDWTEAFPFSNKGGKRAAKERPIRKAKAMRLPNSEDDFVVEDSEAEASEVLPSAASGADSDTALVVSRRPPARKAPLTATERVTRRPESQYARMDRYRRAERKIRRRHGNISEAQVREIANSLTDVIGAGPSTLTRKQRERKKLEQSHPSIKSMWTDLEKIPVIKPVAAVQPESINRKLKPFQLEGIDWMMRQEKTQYKGGLLGDEMGMGKTIQAVSLIMSDYPQKQPTLVVVPPVALMQWSTEIGEYTDGKLNVLVYHGQNTKVKNMKIKELRKCDVIMISYNSLESLHRKETKGWSRGDDIIKEDSPIHAIHFHRIILDEAHSIKSRTTGVAKACFALNGTYKWCLSGTPVQNRIGEFFSLLRFLAVRPFSDYFCKRCPCSMLHWELDSEYMCKSCKHSGMEHVSVFNQELLNPLTQPEEEEDRSRAMDKLHMITARIMLRRMKRDYTSSMELPPKEVIVHNEFFGEIERDFSSSIMSNTTRQFDTYVARGVMLNNYANIFGLIMQMRQVANHPDLILKRHAQEGQNVLVCNICDEVAEDAIRSQCKHDFCRACVKSYVQSVEETGGEADCPRCHISLSIDFDQPEIEQDEDVVKKSSIINRIKMEDWTSSTKIEMLIYDLYKLRSKKQTLKSIVFSQFTSMLQLIEWRLRRAGFNTVMLDGSMTPIQRQRSIEHFMTNPDCEIFLVSLKAGGVALNLTEASRVFIVDP